MLCVLYQSFIPFVMLQAREGPGERQTRHKTDNNADNDTPKPKREKTCTYNRQYATSPMSGASPQTLFGEVQNSRPNLRAPLGDHGEANLIIVEPGPGDRPEGGEGRRELYFTVIELAVSDAICLFLEPVVYGKSWRERTSGAD